MRRLLLPTLGGLLLAALAGRLLLPAAEPADGRERPIPGEPPRPPLAPAAAPADGRERPIPQDPERQRQWYRDLLAWNRRTLEGAYDQVGKKDPRWDQPAREALEAAARYFSRDVDPVTTPEQVHDPAKRARDAGCDDPLVTYLYARSSVLSNYPGPEELERLHSAAAAALERSDYPPNRRAAALIKAAELKVAREDLTPEGRKEAARLFDATLDLLPQIVAEGEHNRVTEPDWYDLPQRVREGYRRLTGDLPAAFDRVDAVMARVPALRATRLQLRGDFLREHAWEARGTGSADTVTEEGWRAMNERLIEAREVLEAAWAIKPNDPVTATQIIPVLMGLNGDRDEMEQWFERAMKADGNLKAACIAKMEWLDPKWFGSREEVLAFGRACRDTKNWRAGITLLLAEAHSKAAMQLTQTEWNAYFRSAEVWDEIKGVYEEYLERYPADNTARSKYAGYCVACRQFPEANRQFQILGKSLVGSYFFSKEWLERMRDRAAAKVNSPGPPG